MRAALAASEVAPELPIVIRAFDPDSRTRSSVDAPGDDAGLRIRRAYSVAHLAAPYFVAAALLDEDEENVVTLRLGDEYVNVCQMRVRRASRRRLGRGGRLAGRTPPRSWRTSAARCCSPLAAGRLADRRARTRWHGEEVLLGGRLHDVLDIAWRQKLHRPSGAGRPRAPRTTGAGWPRRGGASRARGAT